MKRVVSFVLMIVMVFCVTACGKDADIRGTYEEGTPGISAAPSATPDGNSFNVGSVKANKYVNKFVGISCELGSEWTYMTDEEIQENNENTLGLLGDDYAEQIQNAATFIDMMATHQNQMNTVNVTFEKLVGVNALLTVEGYIDASVESLKSALSSMGIKNVQSSTGKMNFAGKEQTYLDITGNINGIAMYERMVVVKCYNYMVLITVCTWQTNTCQDILNKFQAA